MAKKLFILALGALLVVAFTVPAMAETKIDFSGSYRVRAFYKNNIQSMSDESDDEDKSSYFDHRLRISTKFMPSDSLTMNVGLNLDGNKWGTQSWGYAFSRGSDGGGRTAAVGNNETAAFFEVRYYWMTFLTSVGKFDIGRQPGGSAGLSSLGYTGNSWHGADFIDTVVPRDRVKYTFASGPLAIVAVYDKRLEVDNATGVLAEPNQEYDADWVDYSITPVYKFANGGATATFQYIHNNSGYITSTNPYAGANVAINVIGGIAGTNPDYVNVSAWLLNPAIVLNFGPFGIHSELAYLTGSADVTWNPTAQPAGAKSSYDVGGLGFYLDATYNYGPGMVGLEYAYMAGDDNTTDDELGGYVTSGGDYTPYLVAFDSGAIAPGWGANAGQPAAQGILDNSNFWLLGAWVDHNLTEDLMMHAGFGYFNIIDPGKYQKTDGTWVDIDDHFGHELDLGLKVNIMPNLSFTTDFGYFWSGAYFDGGRDSSEDALRGTTFSDHGNAYMWKNTLVLSF